MASLAEKRIDDAEDHVVDPEARPEAILSIRLRPRSDFGQRGARMRLRQTHGAHGMSSDLRIGERFDLGVAAEIHDQTRIAHGQQHVGGHSHVARHQKPHGSRVQGMGKPQTSPRFVEHGGEESRLGDGPYGASALREHMDMAMFVEHRLVIVTFPGMRREFVFR